MSRDIVSKQLVYWYRTDVSDTNVMTITTQVGPGKLTLVQNPGLFSWIVTFPVNHFVPTNRRDVIIGSNANGIIFYIDQGFDDRMSFTSIDDTFGGAPIPGTFNISRVEWLIGKGVG